MKTYCFNYSIEGEYTIAPVFICASGENKDIAWQIAMDYLCETNLDRKVTVWFKNFPDMIDKKFQSKRVPQ